jgi:hypothetical protein
MSIFKSNEQTAIWFRDRFKAGELILKPPFQRKPVWTAKQKCHLIESILLGLPIPEIYIQHTVTTDDEGEEKSIYAVVDGQQRIRALLQFIGIDDTESEQEWNKFPLDKLDAGAEFKDRTYASFSPDERKKFLEYQFAVRELQTQDDDVVRNIFRRLNKFVTKLNDQELRNATYSGPFMQLAQNLADNDYWVNNHLVSPAQIRRMKDIEFCSELLIGVIHGPQGGSAKSIDEYYTQYEDYEDDFPDQKVAEKRFAATLRLVQDILGEDEFTRFANNRSDFYSLFVAIAHIVRTHKKVSLRIKAARAALKKFEAAVDERLADETRAAGADVVAYVRAVEKGANDKKRRADRHKILVKLLLAYVR